VIVSADNLLSALCGLAPALMTPLYVVGDRCDREGHTQGFKVALAATHFISLGRAQL